MMDQQVIDELTLLAGTYPMHSEHRVMITDEISSEVHRCTVTGYTVLEIDGTLDAVVKVAYPDAYRSGEHRVTGAFTHRQFQEALKGAKEIIAGSKEAFNALSERLRPTVREAVKLGFSPEDILLAASMNIK